MKDKIQTFLKNTKPFVLYIAGGGFDIIGELTRYGGSSSKLLEVVCNQSTKVTDELLGYTPDKYVSKETVLRLAVQAYNRAVKLSGNKESYGVAVTSKLTVDNEREGRENLTYIATHTNNSTGYYRCNVIKGSREEQEKQIVDYILQAIGVTVDERNIILQKEWNVANNILFGSKIPETPLHTPIASSLYEGLGESPVIFPGSFNPLHNGHLQLAKEAYRYTGKRVFLELSVLNPDKPKLDYVTINDRIQGIQKAINNNKEFLAGFIVSACPLFVDKINHYKKPIFVVGGDTMDRISNGNYGDLSVESCTTLYRTAGVKFLYGQRQGLALTIRDSLKPICYLLEGYNDTGVSSTQIRKETT